jgi:hypothetical protein
MDVLRQFKTSLILTLFLSLVGARASGAGVQSCIVGELQHELNRVIELNDFRTTRKLSTYEAILGERFTHDLHALKGFDHHWIDAGSGEGVAIREFADRGRGAEAAASRPQVTGVTYKAHHPLPEGSDARVLSGRFFEDIPSAELGRADLISDLYGVLSYTHSPDIVLQRYLDALKDDGAAYVFLGNFGEMNLSKVTLPSGGMVDLEEWIKRIPGLRVEVVKPTDEVLKRMIASLGESPDFNPRTLRISKLPGQSPKVPRLNLTEAHFEPPRQTPVRELEQLAGP